jgi:hypothetical protein
MKIRQHRWLRAAGAGAVMCGVIGVATPALAASKTAPYVDKNSSGTISLCDQQGKLITQGSVATTPVAWKAVDSTAAPATYSVKGASATLYAYQPRKGVDPGDWSGEQLSGSATFASPAHPTAVLTGLDESLAEFIADYPATWDGFVELRIYLGAPDLVSHTRPYDTANIEVSGKSWHQLGTPAVACAAGSAVPLERDLATNSAAVASLAAQTTTSPLSASKSHSATPEPTVAEAVPAGSQAAGPAGSPSSAELSTQAVAASSSSSGKSSKTLLFVIIGVVVVGAGFVGLQWVRSRR